MEKQNVPNIQFLFIMRKSPSPTTSYPSIRFNHWRDRQFSAVFGKIPLFYNENSMFFHLTVVLNIITRKQSNLSIRIQAIRFSQRKKNLPISWTARYDLLADSALWLPPILKSLVSISEINWPIMWQYVLLPAVAIGTSAAYIWYQKPGILLNYMIRFNNINELLLHLLIINHIVIDMAWSRQERKWNSSKESTSTVMPNVVLLQPTSLP